MFMMMTIATTKRRRYAELYGHYHHGRYGGVGFNPLLGGRLATHDEYFWDEFESGRRGGMFLTAHEESQRAPSRTCPRAGHSRTRPKSTRHV